MARRNLPYRVPVSGARARSIPVFHVDIRLYAIGSRIDRRRQTDVRRTPKGDGDHDYVGLAQARPNHVCYIRESHKYSDIS